MNKAEFQYKNSNTFNSPVEIWIRKPIYFFELFGRKCIYPAEILVFEVTTHSVNCQYRRKLEFPLEQINHMQRISSLHVIIDTYWNGHLFWITLVTTVYILVAFWQQINIMENVTIPVSLLFGFCVANVQ